MLLGLENGPTVRELAAILGGLAARYAKESQTLEATEHAQAIADWELLRKKRPLPDAPLDRARLLEVIGAAYDRGDMFVQKLQAAADDAERRARGEA
jgi:protein involved in polysaccharide export with SLBB domain